nr:carboxylesterase family protein [Verticiella sp. GG226]
MSAESQAALRWVGQRAQRFGGDVRRLLICGWGAGAPAAALCLDLPGVLGGLAVSGVYDLAALRREPAAAAWCVDGHDVLSLSPRRLGPSPRPLMLAYGSADPTLMRDEAQRFAAWRAGMPGGVLCVPGGDRHDLLLSLADPSSTLVAHLCALFATGGASPVHAGRGPWGRALWYRPDQGVVADGTTAG